MPASRSALTDAIFVGGSRNLPKIPGLPKRGFSLEEFGEVESSQVDLAHVLSLCGDITGRSLTEGWGAPQETEALSKAFSMYATYINEMVERRWQTTLIDKILIDLRSRLERLESRQPFLVPIQSFEPEPFAVIKPFFIVLEPSDGEFVAALYDANIAASGETQEEAVSNLKEMILATFELLEGEEKLGAAMRGQKAVLMSIVRRAS
jgi:predicted RNase H-like HicB family nuclease